MNHLSGTFEFSGTGIPHWKELVSNEGFKLNRFCSDRIGPDMLDELCKKHPTLEELRLPERVLDGTDLDNIANHLKKLKILHIKVQKDDHQMITFAEQLRELKHLKIESNGEFDHYGGYNWLNFSETDSHDLEVLELTNMAQSNSDLSWCNWFRCFPSLTTIQLKDCILNDWTDFLAQLSWLENLECLVLDNVVSRDGRCGNYPAKSVQYNIKVLKIRGGEMLTKPHLATLLIRSPNLETIYFLNISWMEKSVVKALKQKKIDSDFILNDQYISFCTTTEELKNIIDLGNNLNLNYNTVQQ